MENDKTKLVGEGRKQYHKTKVVRGLMSAFMEYAEHPCDTYAVTFGDAWPP
jgi:hypothetical protein